MSHLQDTPLSVSRNIYMATIGLLPSEAYIQRPGTLRSKQETTGHTASTKFITTGLFKKDIVQNKQ
jgi:hypothetical protein